MERLMKGVKGGQPDSDLQNLLLREIAGLLILKIPTENSNINNLKFRPNAKTIFIVYLYRNQLCLNLGI